METGIYKYVRIMQLVGFALSSAFGGPERANCACLTGSLWRLCPPGARAASPRVRSAAS